MNNICCIEVEYMGDGRGWWLGVTDGDMYHILIENGRIRRIKSDSIVFKNVIEELIKNDIPDIQEVIKIKNKDHINRTCASCGLPEEAIDNYYSKHPKKKG